MHHGRSTLVERLNTKKASDLHTTFRLIGNTVLPRRLGKILPNNHLCPLLQLGYRKSDFRTIWNSGQVAVIGVFRVSHGAKMIAVILLVIYNRLGDWANF
jgi:hypothetical protein